MRLDPDNCGWIDCCENCLDRVFRSFGGVWIGIHEDEVSTKNLRCTDGNHHVPIGVDPPTGGRCPHDYMWDVCPHGCVGLDGEYIPRHGHEMPTEDEVSVVVTTEEVSCCHCGQPIKPSTWREKRWFYDRHGNNEGMHTCPKAPRGYHEPWPGMADTSTITRKKKTDA